MITNRKIHPIEMERLHPDIKRVSHPLERLSTTLRTMTQIYFMRRDDGAMLAC
jgi:hypothetical protein